MDKILVLDFGSQYTQLIARRVREVGVYSEIYPYDITPEEVGRVKPTGIILSGSPASANTVDSPSFHSAITELGIPILGICYGMQLIASRLGGSVSSASKREYGRTEVEIDTTHPLFCGIDSSKIIVWMSHGDKVTSLPLGFHVIAKSQSSPIAAMANDEKKIYGLQFHPEVVHTNYGREIISNFVFRICDSKASWSTSSFIDESIQKAKDEVGDGRVLMALSGGVDSSVAAVLLYRAIGDRLVPVFVDNGLLRKGERESVVAVFQDMLRIPIRVIDASDRFLRRLEGVGDPERKRKIIGEEFIRVFEEEARKVGGITHLMQGTLYPDVIESRSVKGPSAVIKSHHNVGGLPKKMGLKLIEPFKFLFKDEVRRVGKELGLPHEIIARHPFPGPGLAVRVIGEVTRERLDILREADFIAVEEIREAGWYERVWQAFAVLLPVKTVGVMGDERTYENVVALRVVNSEDGMTADWTPLPYDILARISTRIINEVKGVNRVVYDVSSKPPATIEWE